MSTINGNLGLNRPERESLFKYFRSTIFVLCTDWVFVYLVAAVVAKSILFLGLINNDGVNFDGSKAIKTFSYHPPISVYFAFAVAVLSLAFLFKGRVRFWFLAIFNLLFSALLVADLLNYRAAGTLLSAFPLFHGNIKTSQTINHYLQFHLFDLTFVVDNLVLFVLGIRWRNLYLRARVSILITLLLCTGSVYYLSFIHNKLDIRGDGGDSRLFSYTWLPVETMSNLSPLGYHLFDTYSLFMDRKSHMLSPTDQQKIVQWYADKQEQLPPNKLQGIFKGQNVIFIQVESLENFVINQTVNGQQITPNLNKLLQNSFYLPNVYEQVYNGNSSDADLLANTSVYPVRNGITFFRFPLNTYNSFPKLLQELGYTTTAAHADNGAHWNWVPALSSIGFQKTLDSAYFKHQEDIGLGLSDGSFFSQIEPYISSQKQPFYDYLVTLTSHGPFDLPQKYRGLKLAPSLDSTKLGGYFQCVHYTDQQIGNFIKTLDQKGLLDNTVIVIYGDHSGVHKYYNDEVKQIEPQQNWWLDDSSRVPLIIYHKGLSGQKINTIGGQVDIFPTIAPLLGIDENCFNKTAMGRNLLNTQLNFAVLANGKFIGTNSSKPTVQANAIQGINIADLIIQSNYFKQQKPKK